MAFGIFFKTFATRRTLVNLKCAKWLLNHCKCFTAQSYWHHPGKDPLVYRNIGQELERSIEACGDRIAFISIMENIRMTFQEVKDEADILAIRLGELGLEQGDHLGIWNMNTKQWYITWLAASLGGFPLVCLNPALQPPELAYCLKKARVNALITAQEIGPLKFELVLKALFENNGRKNFPALFFVLMQGKEVDSKHFLNYDELFCEPVSCDAIEQLHCQLQDLSPEATCNVQFTSGTTGQPKATLLTHFNMVNLARAYGRLMCLTMEEVKKICLPLPFFHVFGLSTAAMTLHFCNTLVLPNPFFKGGVVLDIIAQEQCCTISGTPAMYRDLVENQLKQPRPIECLKIGFIGGASVSPDLYFKCKKVLGLEDMRVGYGLSESTSGVVAHDGTETDEEAANTIGKVIEHCEAKIINDKGDTVPFNQRGELCLRGFCVMKGYFEDDEETRKIKTSEGWLKTGDEAKMQPNGVMIFEGRTKNIIIRGGENIFPKEIENVLETHESILEAQAVGVPDKRLGEVVCVYLRLKQGAKPLTEADVATFCDGKLAKYKIPAYVRIIEDFPRTATGKIRKFKLKEMFANEQQT